MTTKLPQYPESMDYDELAYNDLRKDFRMGLFTISEERTVIGSREFGVDWIVGQLDKEHHSTGVAFYIQSKTTNVVEKDNYISIEIDTKNINYLAQRAPTFIHLYQRDQDVGYWLWFQEWYIKNYSSEWRSKQDSVTMKFPTSQKLSDEAVKKIMEIVTNENFKTRSRQAIDLFNNINPDFHYSSPEFVGNGVIVVAEPKHENATFEISVDEVGNEAIRKAHEEGYAVQFSIVSTNAPDPLESVLTPTEEQFITLAPHPDKELLYKLTFVDENKNILHEEKSITFYSVRPGSKEKEYRGLSTNYPIGYRLIQKFDLEGEKATGELGFFCPINDPIGVKTFHNIYQAFLSSAQTFVTDLITSEIVANFELRQLPPIPELNLRYIDAAYNLQQKHGIHILIPTEINEEQLFPIELAEQILTNRKSTWKIKSDSEQSVIRARDARGAVEHYLLQGHVDITRNLDHIGVTIGDEKIDLGVLRGVWRVSNIRNLEEIQNFLSDPSTSDEDTVNLEVEFDEENSYTISVEA